MELVQNQTVTFVFLGFSSFPEPHLLFFLIFLMIYLTALLGNGLILTTASLDSGLHSPMYYFIRHLSFLDICYTSVTLLHMLKYQVTEIKTISIQGCLVQLYFLVAFLGIECLLLAVMAYDRYVAICHPLTYVLFMNRKLCTGLVATSWVCGFLNTMLHTAMTAQVPFCASHEIENVFCDVPQLLKLSCQDTFLNQITLFVVTLLLGVSPFLCIMAFYIHIVRAILRIRTTQGRHKAFSTCSSHLIVVTIFYSTCMFNYNRPSSCHSVKIDTLASVLYNVVTPALNPIIFSLRNKEMKEGLKHILKAQMPFFL